MWPQSVARSQRLAQHVGVLKNIIMGVNPISFIFVQLWLLCAAVRPSIDEEARAIELGKMSGKVQSCHKKTRNSVEKIDSSSVQQIFSAKERNGVILSSKSDTFHN